MGFRGQSAIEYLMTYGWAILVVLVVGVVMWQMGLLQAPGGTTPDKRGFSQVTPLDWVMNTNKEFNVVIQNNAGTILLLDSAGAVMVIGGTGSLICTYDGSSLLPAVPLRPAASRTIKFTGCPLAPESKMGEYYRVNLTIGYHNPSSGLPHISNGVVWGPIG